jgi:hypothetical protein
MQENTGVAHRGYEDWVQRTPSTTQVVQHQPLTIHLASAATSSSAERTFKMADKNSPPMCASASPSMT